MQTHKQVEELGCSYEGHIISTENIYKKDGIWYIAANQVDLCKDYPIVRDTIFFTENNEPIYTLATKHPDMSKKVYHPLSSGTAKVLMRQDGYAHLGDLAREIRDTPGNWISHLPHAQSYPIRAQIEQAEPMEANVVPGVRTPQKTPLVSQVLAGVDFIVIDVPGTVIYNVAIPFIAPFKFFYEFCTTE